MTDANIARVAKAVCEANRLGPDAEAWPCKYPGCNCESGAFNAARAAIAAMPPSARERELEEALGFYADPETYFAIGFFPDPPCGEFVDDFSEVEDATGFVGPRPGKRARDALAKEMDVG